MIIICLSLAILFISLQICACTGIELKANDGGFVHGRTLEFGIPIETEVAFIPRGYEFTGATEIGSGLKYKAKYATVGAIVYNQISVLDGINEKGLAVGTFYFPDFAEYAVITSENQSRALSPFDFPNWIITQFATVEEVKEAIKTVFIAPIIAKEWGDQPPPFHYIVHDSTGKSLVIEPIKGQLIAYDNPLGVLTNSPSFDWHMTNLRNYIHLSPNNAQPVKVGKTEITPIGQGSGLIGMPGDFTPPSRFVRAAIYSATAIPSNTTQEAIFQAFHILNQFDIPVGVARANVNGVMHTDYTMLTCVRDPKALKYYFKSYEDQTIQAVDLNQFDWNGKEVKKADTKSEQGTKDISTALVSN